MIRLGVVNIDVSHPKAFAEYLQTDNRARYAAVYNDGFREPDEVEGFCKRFGVEKICSSVGELADLTDLGMIQGCNWDKHLEYAKPFLDRGKPVFIDKPMVGNLEDCRKLQNLAAQGHVLLGSSSARYCYEIQEFLKQPQKILHASATVGMDEFNYAIHAVEGLGGLMGTGAQSVTFSGCANVDSQRCETYFIQFHDGKTACYHSVVDCYMPFHFSVLTTTGHSAFTVDNNRLYGALLDRICDFMEGKGNHLAPVESLLESIKIMLAGKASKENGGIQVPLERLADYSVSFDGNAFEKAYRAAAKKIYL